MPSSRRFTTGGPCTKEVSSTTAIVNVLGPVPGRPDPHSDGPFGWLAPRGARCGLTRTPIDRTCLSPDLSAARERLAVRFASPMPVTREGPDLHGLVTVLSVHSVLAKPSVHANPEAGNGDHRRASVASSAASIPTKICTSQPSSMNRIGFSAPDPSPAPGRATGRCSPGCAPSASFSDRSRVDRQLRRGPAALHAASRRHGPGGPTPDKQDRRRRGKNDDLDAQNAAHAAFAASVPSRREAGRHDRSPARARRVPQDGSERRRIALQMIHNTIVAAPDGLRDQLRVMTRMQLVRTLASWRPDLTAYRDLDSAYRIALKSLARRYLELHDEIADLDAMIAAIVDELAPNLLVARNSIGHIGAAQLLLTAGGNPERLRSEASFASLCGVSPVPASSGKTVRHRLNRGGDRAANSALHIITAIGRLRTDQRTKDDVARRIAEGHSKLDAIRALKRYLAREVFTLVAQRRREINATQIAA